MPQKHIVALGSSFAAGPGIAPTIDKAAWRSGNNYPHLLAAKLDAKLTDLTSSGATLLHVLSQPQAHALSTSPAQLDRLPADADIVTLTAGGNDLGLIGGMMTDAIRASVQSIPLIGSLFQPVNHENEERLSVDEVTNRFISVIDRIKAAAPNATIYLVEYLTVLGPSAEQGPENPLNDAQIRHHRQVADSLLEAYSAAAKACPAVKLVSVAEASQVHGVGAQESWMSGFTPFMLLRGEVPYHPNLKGHQAVADILFRQIAEASASP